MARFRLRQQPASESEWGKRAAKAMGCWRRQMEVAGGDTSDGVVLAIARTSKTTTL
jgi:hypothetical protein